MSAGSGVQIINKGSGLTLLSGECLAYTSHMYSINICEIID